MRPFHDPDADPVHPGIIDLLRSPRGLQKHVISGVVKAFARKRAVFFGLAPGTGKTFLSLASAHLMAGGRPYAVLIVCPPTLVGKWEREIVSTVPGPTIHHVNGWEEWLELGNNKPVLTGPTFFISPLSTAKLGAKWIPAVSFSRRSGGFACPQCFKPVFHTDKGVKKPMPRKILASTQCKCRECKSPLWQYVRPHKIEPSILIKRKFRRWFDVAILDEAHVMKAADTKAGISFSHFVGAARKIMVLTGTMIAGRAEDLRPTLFRIMPQRFKELGLKWNDDVEFNERYGRIEYSTATFDGKIRRKDGNTIGAMKKRTDKKVVPGLMPGFYRDFLVDCTVFCSLREMMEGGHELPELKEVMMPVEMSPSMQAEYEVMKHKLMEALLKLRKEDAVAAMNFTGTVTEALCTWPDDPYGWQEIGYTDKDGRFRGVYKPSEPVEGESPKEQRLVKLILEERQARRQVWIFSTRTETSNRLLRVLVKNKITCAYMTASVPTIERESWIRDYGVGVDCILSHPELCSMGLDFFGYGPGKYGGRFNFSTIIHY